jgi:anti-sigma regulatory factor (Ser/Thr protein kinase)
VTVQLAGTIRLSIPPAPDQISTVRSLAFAVGQHAGLSQEAIEDLKLALTEIVTEGIQAGGSSIVVDVAEGADALEVSVETPDAAPSAPDAVLDRAQIVRALFPTVRVRRQPGGVVTSFSVERG